MKTLDQFKAENNIAKIDLLKGKGRMYAQVGEKQLVVSSKCDLSKPVFVTGLNEQVDKTQPIDAEGNSRPVPNAYLLVNSTVQVAGSI